MGTAEQLKKEPSRISS